MADRALLVGINSYPGAPLSGCVNDVTDMAHYLVQGCGYAASSVRLLTDARATTKAILERLDWLTTGLVSGDRIFFHYSGHGAQVAARNLAGEVDGLDEVACPIDFDWTNAHMIRDDDFNRIFSRIPAGVTATWVSDSCHSADQMRAANGLGGRTERRLLPPVDIAWRNATVPGHKTVKPKPVTLPNIALISGCRTNQTSADAHFSGKPNGALTYYLLHALKAASGTPLNVLIPGVCTALRAAGFEQEPQIEGPAACTHRTFSGK